MSNWSEGTWPNGDNNEDDSWVSFEVDRDGFDALFPPRPCPITTMWGGVEYACQLTQWHAGRHEAVDGDMKWQTPDPRAGVEPGWYQMGDFSLSGPLAHDLLNMGGMLDRMNLPDPLEDQFKERGGP